MIKQALADLYLDWFNNYLTVANFADAEGITLLEANQLIALGKKYHEERVTPPQRRAS